MAQDFLYGLAQPKFAATGTPQEPGYMEEGRFGLGGQAGETTEINAAQVKGSPVLVLPKKNGTVKPKSDLIEINHAKLALLMGGTATAGSWNAPSDLAQAKGHAGIHTGSGHLIDIPSCILVACPSGKPSLDGVAKIHCETTPVQSAPGVAPYSISDIPGEGEERMEDRFRLEPQAADALLDAGVRIPLKTVRVPFRKSRFKCASP